MPILKQRLKIIDRLELIIEATSSVDGLEVEKEKIRGRVKINKCDRTSLKLVEHYLRKVAEKCKGKTRAELNLIYEKLDTSDKMFLIYVLSKSASPTKVCRMGDRECSKYRSCKDICGITKLRITEMKGCPRENDDEI